MADEFRRALAKRDTLVAQYMADMAALKETHGNDMAAMKLELEHLSPWAELPKELLWMVLEKLQDAALAGGDWGGFEGSKHVRLVCSGWRNSHDALVTRLTVSRWTTDEGMWLLVRRFPAVVSLEVKGADYYHRGVLTNDELWSVPSVTGLAALTFYFSSCDKVTDEGLRAVSSLTGLTTLNLSCCKQVTDEGLQALGSLTSLSFIELYGTNVSAAAKQALRTALPNLTICG
jgi:hypothetical protein